MRIQSIIQRLVLIVLFIPGSYCTVICRVQDAMDIVGVMFLMPQQQVLVVFEELLHSFLVINWFFKDVHKSYDVTSSNPNPQFDTASLRLTAFLFHCGQFIATSHSRLYWNINPPMTKHLPFAADGCVLIVLDGNNSFACRTHTQ